MNDLSKKDERINDLKNILSKYSIVENPALLQDLINWGIREDHPKFELGEECSEVPKVEINSNHIEKSVTTLFSEDESLLRQLKAGKIKHRELEKKVTADKAVELRRRYFQDLLSIDLNDIPYENYDYEALKGACCENPIGYISVPLGIAGPLRIDGEDIYIPFATTEGALIASVSRGCKVVSKGMGVQCHVQDVGMTRAPYISFHDARSAQKFYDWIKNYKNFDVIKGIFESTSGYLKLSEIQPEIVDCYVFIRFVANTGDAMGMNMISKACQKFVDYIVKEFKDDIRDICLSSNYCTDKKAAAVNWIKGRGKNVSATVVISSDVVETELHTSVDRMVELCHTKCNVGSSLANTIGGNNAQAANAVAAMFIATGQDAAQVVSSSMCMTTMTKTETGDLKVTCIMKCLEVGTVGGGTNLAPQQACLRLLSSSGPHRVSPGEHAKRLAKIICSAVLAGEVSLMAALCSGDLVKSHMKMNRSTRNLHANTDTNLLKFALENPVVVTSALNQPKTRIEHSSTALVVDHQNCAKNMLKRSDCFSLI